MHKLLYTAIITFLTVSPAVGRTTADNGTSPKDTVESKSGSSERNVMLNAESATVPREINIGLPASGLGAVLFIDGTKHANGLPRGHFHWAGGNSYRKVGTIGLMESMIVTGEIEVLVGSDTKFGTDKFEGAFTGGTSSFGLIRYDGAISGPLSKAKGWYFNAGAYINFDPTSTNAPCKKFVDKKQIYQFGLAKRWRDSSLEMIYRLSLCDDSVDNAFSVAPFIYNGDGSISSYNGFRLGLDCYFPTDDEVRYMDLATGKFIDSRLGDMDHRYLHDVSVRWRHKTEKGWDFDAAAHLCYMAPSTYLRASLAGTDKSVAGITKKDGTPYGGYVQNRLGILENLRTADTELRFEAKRKFDRHKLRLGTSYVIARQKEAASSFSFAHTVSASPERLYKSGENAWNFNTNALYLDGTTMLFSVYAFDKWTLSDRLQAETGIRICPRLNNLTTAAQLDGQTKNKRVPGFNLADDTLYEPSGINKVGLSYGLSEHLSYRIAGRLFATAEGFFSMTAKSSTYFKNATIPTLKPIGNAYVSGGLNYDNSWMDIAAVVSFIRSWNNAKVINVTKIIDGVSETIPWTAQYGVGTFGITLDGNIHFGGFKLHGLFTWQDPRYKNYNNVFKFSDGSETVIDYTDNHPTGISQILAEIDPSYTWKWLRVWGSLRYFSKQYVSRTNYAFFDGHWETFGGVDFNINDHHKISVNLINILGQNGAKGSVDIADTIEDPSVLQGLVMAGTYIRPFTAELSYTFKF